MSGNPLNFDLPCANKKADSAGDDCLFVSANSSPYKQNVLKHKKTNQLLMNAFTLIELMVTLSVLAILLMVAIPSFQTMILNSRLSSNADTFVNALNYARNTALSQAMNVKVCPLSTPGSSTCGTDWTSGWIVVSQPSGGTDTLIKSQQSTNADPELTANVSNVIFDPHGLSTTQSNFTLCDSRGSTYARSIEVLATGYVQAGATPGQAVWNNGALACP